MSEADPPPDEAPIERRAARVLVIDPSERLLVFGVRDRADGHIGWFMPGGGIESGESAEQTARRELLEELAMTEADDLRGPLWSSHYEFSWNGRRIIQDEWFFALRLASALDAAAIPLSDPAGATYDEVRWLSLDELAAIAGLIGPPDLIERLRSLPSRDQP